MTDQPNIPKKIHFANYSRRIQAVLLDGIIILVILVSLIIFVSHIELSQPIKICLFVFAGVLFEPVLVSIIGASLGHHYKGLRVEKDGCGKNLNILEAMFRFFVKSTLGIFSLVFFLTTKRHKALHDLAVNSVVVMNKTSLKKGIEGVSERVFEERGFKNASKLRRVLIIALYTFLVFILLGVINVILSSSECIDYNQCTSLELVIGNILGFVFIGLFFTIVYLGWHGRLWGCRRVKVEN